MDLKKFGAIVLIIVGLQILILPILATGSITGFAAATKPEEPAINTIVSICLILSGLFILIAKK
ncbi:MAG: hypothetical protein ACOCZQ_00435 [Nanoarchaeota archaeon]